MKQEFVLEIIRPTNKSKSGGSGAIRILKQTHRGEAFGHSGSYEDPNGFKLISSLYPEIDSSNFRLYVQGSYKMADNSIMTIIKAEYLSSLLGALYNYANEFDAIVEVIHCSVPAKTIKYYDKKKNKKGTVMERFIAADSKTAASGTS